MQDIQPTGENNDQSLALLNRLNDEKTLEEIYAANYPAVEKFIKANSGSTDDAKDIYQEAFLAFWRNVQLKKFEPRSGDSIGGYLIRIARNKWIDVLRKEKREGIVSIDAHTADSAYSMEPDQEEYLNLVKGQYRTLGEPCRELLYRFYFVKEKLRTIAAHFSWTEATAKNNKYRCLGKLKDLLLPNRTSE